MALRNISNATIVKSIVVAAVVLGTLIGTLVITLAVTLTIKSDSNGQFTDYIKGYKNSDIVIQPTISATVSGSQLPSLDISQQGLEKPYHGSIKLGTNNTIIYHSEKYFAGNDTFEYYITYGQSSSLKVKNRISVLVMNRDPKALPLTFEIAKNSHNNLIDIFAKNDKFGLKVTDDDDDILQLVSVSSTKLSGSVTSFSSKQIIYTPCTNCIGFDSFSYTVTDFNSTVSSIITINLINTLPSAVKDDFTIPKNKLATLNVLSNDIDENLDELYILSAGTGEGSIGSVVVSTDKKSLIYYPKADAKPYVDVFSYVITDDLTNPNSSSTSSIHVTVTNSAPNAPETKQVYVSKNSANSTIDLTFTDNDILDTVNIEIVTTPKRGYYSFVQQKYIDSVDYLGQIYVDVLKLRNQLLYSPEKGVSYSETFNVKVTDGYSTLTTSIIINVVNTPPVSVNDTITCTKNNEVVVDVISNDYDVDGDSIFLSTTDWEPNSFNGGEVFRTNDKSITYKAPQGFVGVDTVRYYITDGESISYGFLTVNVQTVKPVAVNDVFFVPKGLKTFLNVLNNDYSPSKDEILLSFASIRSVEESSVVRSLRNNIYGYEYSASNVEYVDTFNYKVVDVFGFTSDAAIVTVKVINTPPKAVDDDISVSWNRDAVLNILQNDYDENPSDNQLLIVKRTIHGENQTVPTPVIFESGKKLLLSPPNGFTGTFEFFYVISDTFDESNVAKVTVSIVNHQPIANNDQVNVHWRDGIVVINSLQNDSDEDGDTLVIKSFTQPSKGFVVKKALPDGTEVFEYSILASTEFVGIDTFEYEITDNGKSAKATVYVNVTNFAPVSREDLFNVHWNAEQQEYDILANDFDVDSDPLQIVPNSLVIPNQFHGQAEMNADGTALTFKPSISGVFTLTYRISDTVSQSFETQVTFNVTNLEKPIVRTIEKNIHWTMNQPISIPITTATRDSDGDLLFISSLFVKQPKNGSVESVNYGDENSVPSLVYKKNPGFFGFDIIQVLLNDGLDSAVVTIKVNSINQVPTCKTTIKESVFWKNLPYVRNSLLITDAFDQDNEDVVYLKSVANIFNDITSVGDEITFSPLKGFIDERSAQLIFSDGLDICTSIFNIKVNDSKPQANPTLSTIHWSKSSTLIDVLSTIMDTDGDSCDFNIRSQSDYTIGSASIELNANTKFVKWTVSNDKNLGESTFDIEYTDGYLSDIATYTVKVYNNPPIIPEKTIQVHWSKYINGISINLLQDVIDNDVQDTVTIPLNSWVTSKVGTVTMTSDKVALYKPKQSYLGDDEINFTVTDGLAIVNATYYVKVINRKPIAVDDNISVHWNDTSVDINVLTNDYDPDQEDTIYIASLLTEPSAGRIEKISTTTVRYYLPEDHSVLGDFAFRYSVTDGTEVSEATVTVDIVNRDYPQEVSISRSIHWREIVIGLPINIVTTKNDQDGDLILLNVVESNYPTIFSISNDIDLLVKSEGPIKGEFNASVSIFDGISIGNAFVHTSIYNHAPTSSDLYFNFHWSTISKGVYIDLVQRSNDVDLQDKSKLVIKHAEVIEGPDTNAITLVNNTLYFKPSILEIGNTTINFIISDGFEDSDLHTMIIESRSVVALKADQYYDAHWRSFAFGNIYALDQSFSNEEMITLLDVIQLPNQGGNVIISTIRNVTYYPKENFIGDEVFAVSYTTGITSSNITVHVNVFNNNPQGSPKEYETHWRNPLLMNVLNGASDQDDLDTFYLFPELVEGPDAGSLSKITHDGSVTFTPNITSGYIGKTTFYFRINDGNKVSAPTPVSLTINNNPPIAHTKVMNIMWKNFLDGVEFDVISTNPIDTDTDSLDIPFLFIKSFNQPLPFGDVSRLSSSRVKIQGSSSFIGSTLFSYVLSDGANNGDSTGTVSIQVYNNKPNLTQDSITTHWNVDFVDIDVLSNDFDIDNNPLLLTTLKNYASTESQIILNNKVRYFPRSCFSSSDKFTYTVSDGIESSESEVNVIILNNKPIAKDYNTSQVWHNAIGGVVFDIVSESVDIDGDSISIVKFSSIPVEQGTLQFTNNNKSIIYTPRIGFIGNVETISYVITDGRDEASGTVDIEITNNFPSLSVTSISTHWRSASEGTLFDLSSKFVDIDGDNVILEDVITQANKGSVEITNSKTIKYQSSFSFKGTDSFSLQLSDGYNFVVISMEIDVTNNLPILADITIQTLHRLSENVIIPLINRTDSFKPKDLDILDNNKLTITAFTQPGIGSVAFFDSNETSFTFSNVLGNLLEQTFSFTISDGLESSSATITIQILNSAPILIDITKSFHWRSIYEQGGSVALDILSDSSALDSDGDNLTVKSFTQPNVGSVSSLNTSHIIFTPVTFKAFTTNFKFTVSDGAQQVEKQFDISVTNTNPKAVDDNLNKLWSNKVFTFSPLVNDYDDNSDPITIVSEYTEKVSRLRSATITVSDDLKSITYTDSGFLTTGSDSFSYTITDGVATSTAMVYITFNNTEPSIESFGISVKWDESITLDNLLGRCKDVDGDNLSFVGITQGMLGTTQLIDSQIGKVQYSPNRALTYTNKPSSGNWTVVDTILYTCTDSVIQKSGTISITIYNEPPKGKDISISQVRNYNNPQIIIDGYSILSQSTDSNLDPVTITSVKLYDNQDIETSVVLQPDSSIKFKYGKPFIGIQKFYYTISDGQLENTYTFTVQILGSPSLCLDYTISTFKDALSTAFGSDLNSKLNLAFNGEPISVSVTGTESLSSVGTINTIDNTLTYTPNKRRSCIDNGCYAIYTAINAAGQSATCKIIVNQINQAPNNPSYTYKYSARRDGNNLMIFDYLVDAAVKDLDSTDSVSIQSISSLGTCSDKASISISNGKITFTRQASFLASTCTFTVKLQDDDELTPSYSIASITVNPIISPPLAVTDNIMATFNTNRDIDVSVLLQNDVDLLGGTMTFDGLFCPDATYCKNGLPTLLNSNTIRIPFKTGSCEPEKVQYRIKSTQDGSVSYANIVIRYAGCVCTNIFDIVFIVDGSYSISDANWVSLKSFFSNITQSLNVGPSDTRIGIVQYSADATVELDLNSGTSSNDIVTRISNISQKKSSTASIYGIDMAVDLMVSQGRSNVPNKLFIHVTDGQSNMPCSCGECKNYYGAFEGCNSVLYPGKSCDYCSWSDPQSRCAPCSDYTEKCQRINKWRSGNNDNPEASKNWNYRMMSIGIGDGVNNPYGLVQLEKSNYDPSLFHIFDWNNLNYKMIVDESCANSYNINSETTLQNTSYTDSQIIVQYSGRSVVNQSNIASTTFTYTLTAPSSTKQKSIKKFVLSNSISDPESYVSYNPSFPVFVGTESFTNLFGFVWDSIPSSSLVPMGSTKTVTITVCGDVPESVISFGVVSESFITYSTIKGPTMSQCIDRPVIDPNTQCFAKSGASACSGHGLCVQPDLCQCSSGYTGTECQTPICFDLTGNFACSGSAKGTCTGPNSCQCQSGWTGTDCSIPICFGLAANNAGSCGGSSKGTCISKDSCQCQTGWTGSDCSIPICYSKTGNSACSGPSQGSCISKDTCQCQSGWTGTDCSIPICFGLAANNAGSCGGSSKGTCISKDFCQCQDGWTGSDCSIPVCFGRPQNDLLSCSGSSKGYCVSKGSCSCQTGWTGFDCSLPICYGVNSTSTSVCGGNVRGTCISKDTCQCQSGWTGSDCTAPVCYGTSGGSACGGSSKGTCTAPNTCSCLTGWTSADCTTPICYSQTGTSACGGSSKGTCSAPNSCSCASGWSGSDCTTPICYSKTGTSACGGSSKGTCTAPDTCSCASGWSGSECATPVCPGNCNGRGSCVAPNSCSCNSGWSGSDCSTPVCTGNCNGRGSCTSPNSCSCNSGWSGSDCSVPVCSGGCGNGYCSSPGTCSCNSGWSGAKCSTPVCSGGCGNGYCSSPGTCSCNSGWSGTTCTTPVCSGGCGNGYCSSPGTCSCNSGWSGTTCTTPLCSGGCGNGYCSSPGTCSCNSGWSGTTCSTPVCSGGCGNGRCSSPGTCSCNSGWSGTTCTTPICSTCNGRGSCVGPESCSCSSGWTGNLCQTPVCSTCNGRGSCVGPESCSCNSGWTGNLCQTASCTNNCNGRGTCVGPNSCSCQSGYTGSACETCTGCCNGVPASNFDVCSSQGRCVNGACQCYSYACGYNCQQCGCNGNHCP